MNALESQLHYPFGDDLPAPGTTREVAPGVKWIRMALPFVLDHINLWLLRDEVDGRQGWSVVDCCIAKDESKAQWEDIFATQLEGLPILRVMVTHMHPDHVGLASWLCERWNAPLWMSATDFHLARYGSHAGTSFGGEGAARFFGSHGLTDPVSVEQVRGRSHYYSSLVPSMPERYCRMMDGDTIRIGAHHWTAISGYGHAPEHISLYCPDLKVLIGGDMMLPRISTNVSVFDIEPESNPLTLFLRSIDKFVALPADTLTLPSHGKPFKELHTRITQLHNHHLERMAEVMSLCKSKPSTGMDVVPVMFKRPLDIHQMTFALGEAVAHLHALWFAGKLKRVKGEDGVFRFSAV